MTRRRVDSRVPLAEAMYWVSMVSTVGLELAIPAGVGVWLDRQWGTSPWLVMLGALVGFATAMGHLLRLAQASDMRDKRKQSSRDPSEGLQTNDRSDS